MSASPGLLLAEALAATAPRGKLAVFIERVGSKVRVNVGVTSVVLSFVGLQLPPSGHAVQMELRDGEWVVSGPASPLPSTGKITAVAAPLATVTAWLKSYTIAYLSSYTPTVGDDVDITWSADGGRIMGRASALATAPGSGTNPVSGPQLFHPPPFTAIDSGSRGSSWFTNDVYASDSNIGAWFYGSKVADTIPDNAAILASRIYLNPRQVQGNKPNLGYHGAATKPGGALSVLSASPLNATSGWVDIPVGLIAAIIAGGGIGFNHGGYNIFRGTAADGLSGALDITYQA